MKKGYWVSCLLMILLALLPCPAFAVNALTVNGSSYNSTALSGDLSGAGWSWSASANGGQGELTLNGYNGGAIGSTDGILNVRLIGENIITSAGHSMLEVGGNDTGLSLYGSDPDTDRLTARSTIAVAALNEQIYGIRVTISNSQTIPITFSHIGYVFDLSAATAGYLVPGYLLYPNSFYGLSVQQTVINPSLLGIAMQMDDTVITMSKGASNCTFDYGMWANPYYSKIEAVFNACTFNLSGFIRRGWYTGRDYASVSRATYNFCQFNLKSDPGATGSIGIHISSNSDTGTGVSTLTLNSPSGEIDTGHLAVYSRGAHPALIINNAVMRAWEPVGAEIDDPKIVTVFDTSLPVGMQAQSVGKADVRYMGIGYYQMAARILFTRTIQPVVQPPQTGDPAAPALYGLLLVLAAAGMAALRNRVLWRSAGQRHYIAE